MLVLFLCFVVSTAYPTRYQLQNRYRKIECPNVFYYLIVTHTNTHYSERIGWIPLSSEVPDALKGEYKWIEGLSVTEMEIMHGAYRRDNPNGKHVEHNQFHKWRANYHVDQTPLEYHILGERNCSLLRKNREVQYLHWQSDNSVGYIIVGYHAFVYFMIIFNIQLQPCSFYGIHLFWQMYPKLSNNILLTVILWHLTNLKFSSK